MPRWTQSLSRAREDPPGQPTHPLARPPGSESGCPPDSTRKPRIPSPRVKDIFLNLGRQALAVRANTHVVICERQPGLMAPQPHPLCQPPSPQGPGPRCSAGPKGPHPQPRLSCSELGEKAVPRAGLLRSTAGPRARASEALTVRPQRCGQHLPALVAHGVTRDWRRRERGDPRRRRHPG